MTVSRGVAVVALLVLGVLALPLVAWVLDGEGTENLIIPVDLVLMAVLGALVWRILPSEDGTARRLLVGAGIGLACALVGLAVFFVLLSGTGGA